MKRVYALIGGIASGKSLATAILKESGAYIIDADVVSKEIYKEGSEVEAKLKKRFPDCVSDGRPDRAKLKNRVFWDEGELKALNDITHPFIRAEIDERIEKADGVVVVVMPLPYGLQRFDGVLNVYAPPDVRIERLVKRDNIDRQLALRIMSSQMSDERFMKAADFTFLNDGDPETLKSAIEKWWRIYVKG